MAKWTYETDIPAFGDPTRHYNGGLEVDDGGQSVSYTIDDGKEEGFFVRLQSWQNLNDRYRYDDPDLAVMHDDFAQFAGRRVRVTVETVDDPV